MNPPSDQGTWNEYQRLVMSKLEALESGQLRTEGKLAQLQADVAVVKTKAGVWGAIAGALPVSAAILWQALTKKE